MRCIATIPDIRCPHRATEPGVYTCADHYVPPVRLDRWNTEEARRLLAYGFWETFDEGQALLDEVFNRRKTA